MVPILNMNICITGGGGYIGSSLVPQLLNHGHKITVLDTFYYGDHLPEHENLRKIKGDIRDRRDLARAFATESVVIHLACISNDPSFDLNPKLGEDINLKSFPLIIEEMFNARVTRLIYASSSSIYGVSELKDVTEESPKAPLTDYSKYKLACEQLLLNEPINWTILRPATVCGMSPRMRLDVVVNALTISAIAKKKITLYGRNQKRPNINMKDMCNAYEWVLSHPEKTKHKIYNVGFENLRLIDIARQVVDACVGDGDMEIEEVETNDPRSYHINSNRILDDGFKPKHTIRGAINSIKNKFSLFNDPLNNSEYYNVKKMKELCL